MKTKIFLACIIFVVTGCATGASFTTSRSNPYSIGMSRSGLVITTPLGNIYGGSGGGITASIQTKQNIYRKK